jgi:hypothetical protein
LQQVFIKFGANNTGFAGTDIKPAPGTGAESRAMGWMVDRVGHYIAHYLEKPAPGYEPFTPSDADALRSALKPGDVLLIEGNNHSSGVIK